MNTEFLFYWARDLGLGTQINIPDFLLMISSIIWEVIGIMQVAWSVASSTDIEVLYMKEYDNLLCNYV